MPKAPNLLFSLSKEAAVANMKILQQHGDSVHNYIVASPGTFISPGSEFHSIKILEPLLLHHHNWPRIQAILLHGSQWPLSPITQNDRIAKNNEFISRGNHKSAEKYEKEFLRIIENEINQGWMIPLPIHYINKLMHGELAPIGIDDKVSVTLPNGSKKIKFRLTHDQSFEATIGASVNKRTDRQQLNPLFYGGCLSRLLHYIISLRAHYPNTPILGGKSDFKAAYRRVSLHGDTAEKCAIIYKEFVLPSLRLTFGGSPCSNKQVHCSSQRYTALSKLESQNFIIPPCRQDPRPYYTCIFYSIQTI
jgi:hypothetical protein